MNLESLPDRTNPSVTVSFSGGVLTVFGDGADDNIVISGDEDGTISVNGNPTGATNDTTNQIRVFPSDGNDNLSFTPDVVPTFGTNSFRVSVVAGAGDDTVNASALSVPVNANGQTGEDLIFGGSMRDFLFGGTGNDTLSGGSGNDSITGDGDADSIIGGSGGDTLNGSAGNDTVSGGSGNDVLFGGTGDDYIVGGTGGDSISGQAGADSIDAFDGFGDSIVADAFDYIVSADGLDTVTVI